MFLFRILYEKVDKVTTYTGQILNKCSKCKKYITPKITDPYPQQHKKPPKNSTICKGMHNIPFITRSANTQTPTQRWYSNTLYILFNINLPYYNKTPQHPPRSHSHPIHPQTHNLQTADTKNQKSYQLCRATPPHRFLKFRYLKTVKNRLFNDLKLIKSLNKIIYYNKI